MEAKKIGNNYYLYEVTTVWLKGKGKRKKLSKYVGKITPKGVIKGRVTKRWVRSIYEYGNAQLLMNIAKELILPLKEIFVDTYKEIIATSIVKVIQSTPLKLIKTRWEKLSLSRELTASLSPNSLSEKLRLIGSDWDAQKRFFQHLLSKSKYLLFDLSSITSYSEDLRLAEREYNKAHLYLRQINCVLIFSQDHNIPVMIKVMPGSIRDVRSFKHIIKEMDLSSSTIVLDRGFSSYYLPRFLEEREVRFILPLRRNLKIIEYELEMEESFLYRRRGINWAKKKMGHHFLYLFEDVKLRAEEETTFIELIREGKRKREEFFKEKRKFGKIAILSNIKTGGEEIYLLYKE